MSLVVVSAVKPKLILHCLHIHIQNRECGVCVHIYMCMRTCVFVVYVCIYVYVGCGCVSVNNILDNVYYAYARV